jgi:hypothetical protein
MVGSRCFYLYFPTRDITNRLCSLIKPNHSGYFLAIGGAIRI